MCDLGLTGPERVDGGRAEAVLCGKHMDQTTHCKGPTQALFPHNHSATNISLYEMLCLCVHYK